MAALLGTASGVMVEARELLAFDPALLASGAGTTELHGLQPLF